LDLYSDGTIWVITFSRIEQPLVPATEQKRVTQTLRYSVLKFAIGFKILFRKFKCECGN
jgi:hypothetical protein